MNRCVTPEDLKIVASLRQSNEDSVKDQDPGLKYELKSVETRRIPTRNGEIEIILYTPLGVYSEGLPVFFNIHGGGFIMAHAWMDGPFCRRIAAHTPCLVVNIEYRLAPETPFPGGLEDCYDAVKWVRGHAGEIGADADRMAIGGYSAGGNLSAAVCLMDRTEKKLGLKDQILCYAPFDLAGVKDAKTRMPEEMNALPPEASDMINRCYLGDDAKLTDELASPLCAKDLTGLPPVFMLVGDRDSLMFSAQDYAERLEEAGVPHELRIYPGMGHAFTHEPIPEADDAWDTICERLRSTFSR